MEHLQTIEKIISEFVTKTAVIPKNLILNNETLIFEEGIFDSMGFMSLITFINENIGIQINDDDLIVENFESIKAIVNFISKKQAE